MTIIFHMQAVFTLKTMAQFHQIHAVSEVGGKKRKFRTIPK